MTPKEVVARLVPGTDIKNSVPGTEQFAPANIALCKYWGKRDESLHLPMTDSLSLSLREHGAYTRVSVRDGKDVIRVNGEQISLETPFAQRLQRYLDLFRFDPGMHFMVETRSTVPIGAGLASSAAGFAALALALDQLFGWQLPKKELSILARLGSGSACRSLWPGFVKWHRGDRADGMDAFAEPLPYRWPELCIGVLMVSDAEKPISSREAMRRTVKTSERYQQWPEQVAQDMCTLETAICDQDFTALGETAESNALAMHATMQDAVPPINYNLPETLVLREKIWKLRAGGLPVYFTQDAGPNLKLLFLERDRENVKKEMADEWGKFSHI